MIECILCNKTFKRISWKHLHYKHNLTIAQYRAMGGCTGAEKACLICQSEFVPSRRRQKCCSQACSYEYRSKTYRGENSAAYGRQFSHTEEAKRKISKNNARYWQGKKRPHIGKKISAKLTGRISVEGLPVNQRLRKSARYKNWRKEVIERDNHICQICSYVIDEPAAHHIKPWANYPRLRFVPENGLALCQSCHLALHAKGYSHNGSIAKVIQAIKAAL